jgi:class 3 adenylate cyclase
MQQIADWLEKLGMSEYAQRFAENGIDASVLRYLTDQDLEKIGVLLGHRRKMLAAIAKLEDTPTAATAAASPSPTPSVVAITPAPAAEVAGERRYLTVLFCDLVGSTSISAALDAEDWRDLVGLYIDAASTAVTEMGGHVAKKLGDGLMALFGYPVAQENDAERAARAGLSIQRALAEMNRKSAGSGKPALNARIGIETGPVVVDAAGEVYGDAPNTAARVQALAEPGAVVLTAQVQRQIAGLFVAEERGSHQLKGVPEPVRLFRLVRASGGGRRSGARQLTPLVGRDEEIAMLMRRWERARQGDGQLVLIVGEPGLGKSRLIEEFQIRLKETPHTWSEWSCSQLLQNTPLHPIAEWGRQRFGAAEVPGERRLADLESTLAQVKLDPSENVPLLAPLLEIPLPKDSVPNVAPQELRRRQLAALTNWVIGGAKNQPLVLVFEDLQWADPTTLDVLRGIAERGALAPLLVVATTRPEFRPPWGMRSHHTTISLAPLDRQQVRQMIEELAARQALPKDVVDGVTERAGGGAAVRRGSDAAVIGARRARRHPSNSADAATIADGAARPTRPGARDSAGRVGDRTRFLLWPATRACRDRGRAAASRAGTARRSRHPAGPGPAARIRLSFQARVDPGRGIRKSSQKPAPGVAPPRRRDPARQVR